MHMQDLRNKSTVAAFIHYALEGLDFRIIGEFIYQRMNREDARLVSEDDLVKGLQKLKCLGDAGTRKFSKRSCENLICDLLNGGEYETLDQYRQDMKLNKDDHKLLEASLRRDPLFSFHHLIEARRSSTQV